MSQPPIAKHSILKISPYVGGKSKVEGAVQALKLSSNENPWGPSPNAQAAFAEQATNLHRYPDGGHLALREAIGNAYGLSASQLICGAGSDELLGILIHAYAGAGDEVLFHEHAFLMYRIYSLSYGATPVTAPEKNLTVDVDALLAAVTERTKIVFVANPNNPTGSVIPFSEIKRLRDSLPASVILGLDAAYAEYMENKEYEDGCSLARTSNTVVFHTFSKIYGLSGLRLGWAYARPEIIDVMNRVRSPFNVNSPALAAGIAAVKDQAYITEMRKKNREERERVARAIAALGYSVVPSHTNFLLVQFDEQVDAVNKHLLSRGVIVREVGNYGLPQYLRISIGTAEENTVLLDALTSFTRLSIAG